MADPSFTPIARLFQSGQHALAEAECRRLLTANPKHPDANHLLGVLLLQTNRLPEALQRLEAAVAARPGNLDAQMVYGTALAMSGQIARAHPCFEKVVRAQPGNLQALYNLGLSFMQQGRAEEARPCFAKLLARDARNVGALMGQGSALAALGRFAEAAESFAKADQLAPSQAEIMENLALAYLDSDAEARAREVLARIPHSVLADRPRSLMLKARLHVLAGQNKEAVLTLLKIVERWPDYREAWTKLKEAIGSGEQWEEAYLYLSDMLKGNPGFTAARFCLGSALYLLERHEEAIQEFQRILTAEPNNTDALHACSLALREMGRFDEALELQRQAARLEPDNQEWPWEMAITSLCAGRLKEGWELFEARLSPPMNRLPLRFPSAKRWSGNPSQFQGRRVLIWGEQGIGDEMAFLSALPEAIKLGSATIVECAPKLQTLFARSFPTAEFHPARKLSEKQRNDFDLHLPMGDLFRHFRSSIADFQAKPGYLVPDPDQCASWFSWLEGLGAGRKIGIAWRTSMRSRRRSKYHIDDLLAWAPILKQADTVFICLQPDVGDGELASIAESLGVTVHRPPELDMYDQIDRTAALISGLDLVIATGSSVAFLAGALGVPVWMFHFMNGHWNTLGTHGYPWMPSVRLLSRRAGEDWTTPIEKAATWLCSGPPQD
ncbi:MAG: tetratricopeptide repeat protein [Rhodospirillales bacterium]|nr:MAG: tetratricopeptide repeat protein [Rhodospirillales bacterium]